ncbi:hypothetical protein ACFFX1_55435 [Dactylosporangium sucinum]|uniref:Uncharacterized protein n=1 Tax=Dactylosporangium sucinum TaxID=1424081 RepID=A0A917U4G7_9ACTN|nr:hypothetical protein [Dactylosporangium sucinum]GGM52641.1 hypothetical protein GCM10007977_062770 [Dactylosporangium sucinum]
MNVDDLAPPVEVLHTVAADRARRWRYTETLDHDDLARYIREQADDPNLRADVEAVWRYAAFHFTGRAGGRPL